MILERLWELKEIFKPQGFFPHVYFGGMPKDEARKNIRLFAEEGAARAQELGSRSLDRRPLPRSRGVASPPAPPSTLIVNAITPMLNTNAANECSRAMRRTPGAVMLASEVWKVMPEREREVDEIVVVGRLGAGKVDPARVAVRLVAARVIGVRIMQRIDAVGEQPDQQQRADELDDRLPARLLARPSARRRSPPWRRTSGTLVTTRISGRLASFSAAWSRIVSALLSAQQREQRGKEHDRGGVERHRRGVGPLGAEATPRGTRRSRQPAARGTAGSAAARSGCPA